jgi:hypothetical protein
MWGWTLDRKYRITKKDDFLNQAEGLYKKALNINPFVTVSIYTVPE